ncbi:MAG: 30S ribosomal protein S13 [uncultured bacterium]|nr:MAG: 30S ribosomal protein S13 [uncultured bacterium]HBD05581.1 30S ribosomal protein S13 [Candidatus Uhrbacteria bacterium]
MARIAGINIPQNKRVVIALTSIYGVGLSRSKKVLAECAVDINTKVKDLSEAQVNLIREKIEKQFKLEGELQREVQSNIRRLKEIGSYRGERHKKSLPVRGQRTKTNSRTRRGNVRKTMTSGRRILTKT